MRAKMRNIKFWTVTATNGKTLTGKNKKVLRERLAGYPKEDFKGTKLRQLQVDYMDNADLAEILVGITSSDDLCLLERVTVMSEYGA